MTAALAAALLFWGCPACAPAPPPIVHAYAKPEGAGHARVWIDEAPPIVVRDEGDGDAIAALAARARAGAPADAQAMIFCDKNLSYGVAIALIDALKAQGFKKFALAVQPAPEKQ